MFFIYYPEDMGFGPEVNKVQAIGHKYIYNEEGFRYKMSDCTLFETLPEAQKAVQRIQWCREVQINTIKHSNQLKEQRIRNILSEGVDPTQRKDLHNTGDRPKPPNQIYGNSAIQSIRASTPKQIATSKPR